MNPFNMHERNIILNHDFSEGLNSWHPNCCNAFVVPSEPGCPAILNRRYAIVTNRKECWQSLEQDITERVSAGFTYTVCAWVAVSRTENQRIANVQATLKLENRASSPVYLFIGRSSARTDRWVKVKGTFGLSSVPDRVTFYLEGPSPGIDLLIRSVVISSQHEDHSSGFSSDGDESIISNPAFEDGLNDWSGRGCKIVLRDSTADEKVVPVSGKFFVSTADRTQSWNGIQQEVTGRVLPKRAYEVEALVRISGNNVSDADVNATLWVQAADLSEYYVCVGSVQATVKDWVQLQGKYALDDSPSKVVIFLEGPPPGTDILVDNLIVKHASKAPPASPTLVENSDVGVNIVDNRNRPCHCLPRSLTVKVNLCICGDNDGQSCYTNPQEYFSSFSSTL